MRPLPILALAALLGLSGCSRDTADPAAPALTAYATEATPTVFDPAGPVFNSGFPVGVQPTDDAETLALLASVGYTP